MRLRVTIVDYYRYYRIRAHLGPSYHPIPYHPPPKPVAFDITSRRYCESNAIESKRFRSRGSNSKRFFFKRVHDKEIIEEIFYLFLSSYLLLLLLFLFSFFFISSLIMVPKRTRSREREKERIWLSITEYQRKIGNVKH